MNQTSYQTKTHFFSFFFFSSQSDICGVGDCPRCGEPQLQVCGTQSRDLRKHARKQEHPRVSHPRWPIHLDNHIPVRLFEGRFDREDKLSRISISCEAKAGPYRVTGVPPQSHGNGGNPQLRRVWCGDYGANTTRFVSIVELMIYSN